mmetsp:Transcript_49593/g.116566  ORF Transcript_49593/g.116566 Transcript_49593/m.116566 type:complete len:214 (+) Transcript_49593:1203-1844(+)
MVLRVHHTGCGGAVRKSTLRVQAFGALLSHDPLRSHGLFRVPNGVLCGILPVHGRAKCGNGPGAVGLPPLYVPALVPTKVDRLSPLDAVRGATASGIHHGVLHLLHPGLHRSWTPAGRSCRQPAAVAKLPPREPQGRVLLGHLGDDPKLLRPGDRSECHQFWRAPHGTDRHLDDLPRGLCDLSLFEAAGASRRQQLLQARGQIRRKQAQGAHQ